MKKAAALSLGILLFASGAASGWALRTMVPAPRAKEESAEGNAGEAPEGEAAKPEDMKVEVVTEPVKTGPLPIVIATIGTVKTDPAATYTLSLRAGGKIASTKLSPGRAVAKGEVLLELDPAPLQSAVIQAHAAVSLAASALDEFDKLGRERRRAELETAAQRAATDTKLAEAQVTRLEPLLASGLVADKAVAEAKQTLERARQEQAMTDKAVDAFRGTGAERERATLVDAKTSAEAVLKDAEAVAADSVLRAPADGQIATVNVGQGERVEAGAALATLLLSQGRIVAFQVTARLAHELRAEAPATWEDADGHACAGRVASILEGVESSTGLVEVRVIPDAQCPLLRPGLVVRGEIERSRVPSATLVPDRAVLRSGDRQGVVVAGADGKAHVKAVRVLGRHGGVTAVEGEIAATDRVVVEGGYNLPDGATIVERGEPEGRAPAHDNGDGDEKRKDDREGKGGAGKGDDEDKGKPEGGK
jgi:multidrug efflux pump subunit AcrA (membrane-fusion protein)